MIDFLKGTLAVKQPTRAVIEVHGVGFEVNITLPCYESLGEAGDEVQLTTYLHVREDQMQLFGFSSVEERGLFLHLISISGIGPKKAQAILSSVTVNVFQKYIIDENLSGLTALSGVGKKTAQRLIIDLKDKIKAHGAGEIAETGTGAPVSDLDDLIEEAEAALLSLGFARPKARQAIEKVLAAKGSDINVEILIKESLRLV
ncbi:Holliday junction branch migration protein RuvA [candidate division KSB1 bacterium 4484_87]|nr:MAG: Holliday junction branch migration protein RuvA [candidate division KSB1 bacterium 4484_87]